MKTADLGHDVGMSEREPAQGSTAIVVEWRTLRWAADVMVSALPVAALRSLNIRSGEHLAALLTTAFLITPPAQLDTAGGLDLWFDLGESASPDIERAPILPANAKSAAFEIKSMPGPFRRFDSELDRDSARGIDTKGRKLSTTVRAANDILQEAAPILNRARDQVIRKAEAGTSRNIFLIMHPFDHLAAESFQPVIGPYLDPLIGMEEIDTVWVLWPLEKLTLWSGETHEWMNLIFSAMDPEEASETGDFDVLQDAEDYFLSLIGHTGPSPYLFQAAPSSSAEEN